MPGFGKNRTREGNTINKIYGNDIPIPKTIKILKVIKKLEDKAKLTAEPKNGAEQGVANNVAKAPSKKAIPCFLFLI